MHSLCRWSVFGSSSTKQKSMSGTNTNCLCPCLALCALATIKPAVTSPLYQKVRITRINPNLDGKNSCILGMCFQTHIMESAYVVFVSEFNNYMKRRHSVQTDYPSRTARSHQSRALPAPHAPACALTIANVNSPRLSCAPTVAVEAASILPPACPDSFCRATSPPC